jgi:hypothetical protein
VWAGYFLDSKKLKYNIRINLSFLLIPRTMAGMDDPHRYLLF